MNKIAEKAVYCLELFGETPLTLIRAQVLIAGGASADHEIVDESLDRARNLIAILCAHGLSPVDLIPFWESHVATTESAGESLRESIRESIRESPSRADEDNLIKDNPYQGDSGWLDMAPETPCSRASALIDAAKAANARLAAVSPVRLWQDFRLLNLRKNQLRKPLAALKGFLRVWRDKLDWLKGQPVPPLPEVQEASQRRSESRSEAPAPSPAPSASPAAQQAQARLCARQRGVSPANLDSDAYQMIRRIGDAAYQALVAQVIGEFGCSRWAARLAVHGDAQRAGTI